MKTPTRHSSIVTLLTLLAVGSRLVHADILVWDGSASGYWATAANWSTGTAPQDGDDLVFQAGSARLATTNNTSSSHRFRSITIAAPNYALRGNSLSLTYGLFAGYAAGASSSVEMDITFSGATQPSSSRFIDCGNDGSVLYVTGDLAFGSYLVYVTGAGNVLLGGAISGTYHLYKIGTGDLRLYGSTANTFSGVMHIPSGTLELNKSSGVNATIGNLHVGSETGPATVRWFSSAQLPSTTEVTVNEGAVLDLNNYSEAFGALTLNGGEVQTGSGLLTLGGNVTVRSNANPAVIAGNLSLGGASRTFTLDPGSGGGYELDLRANIRDGGGSAGVNWVGMPVENPVSHGFRTPAIRLGGSNTYAGATLFTNLHVYVAHPLALGGTGQGTTLAGCLFTLSAASVTNESLVTVPGLLPCVFRAGGVVRWAGPVMLGTRTRFSAATAGEVLVIQGVISGSGDMDVGEEGGVGTVTFSGSQVNTYTGITRVHAGTLSLGKSGGNAITGGALIIGDNDGGSGGLVQETADYQIGNIPITINSDGRLDLDTHDDTVSDLTLDGGQVTMETGNLTLGGSLTVLNNLDRQARFSGGGGGGLILNATRTFSVANSPFSPDLRVEVPISGTGGFTKTGAGALGLYPGNSFSGTATINDGLVYLYHDAALGVTTSGTVVNDGGVLVLANDHHVGVEPLTLNGSGDGTAGALASIGGSNSWAGAITLATDSVITVQTNRSLKLTGVVTGPGGLIKQQPGRLFLSGSSPNTYEGVTRVNDGSLVLQKTGGHALGWGELIIGDGFGGEEADEVILIGDDQINMGMPVTINHSGLLFLGDYDHSLANLTFNGGHLRTDLGTLTLAASPVQVNASDFTALIAGRLNLGAYPRLFIVSESTAFPALDIPARISGLGGLSKSGDGWLRLSGPNTYSGATWISDGSVQITSDSALGDVAAGTTVTGAGSLQMLSVNVGNESLALNKPSDLGPALGAGGMSSWAGEVAFNTNVSIMAMGGALEFSGPISGAGGFTKSGVGTLILSGASGNTYAGNTIVEAGTLELGKTAGVAIRHGSLIIGDGVGSANADVVRFLANNQLWSTVPITITGSGLLDLNGHADTVSALTFAGGRATSGASGLLYLAGTVTATNGNGTLQGNIEMPSTRTFNTAEAAGANLSVQAHVTGNGGLTKTGPGQLYLSSSNSFRGTTTISQGSVYADDDFAFGTTDGGTIVSAGAGLVLRFDRHVGGEPLTLNGPGFSMLGALTSGYGSNSWAGPITLASPARLTTFQASDYLHLSGAIGGSGGATLEGPGTILFSGGDANSYAGDTYVNSGTLVLNKSAADGAVPGNLIIGDSLGGAQADAVRLERANQIANAADITITSSGLFDLNGYYDRVDAVTGSGSVTLGDGHLIAGDSGSNFTFDGLVSGTGYLWKVGGGTWTLTAPNTYSGTTRIETGTLLINGSQPASDVLIQSLGILGGTGTVGRLTSTGGALSPGVSPGTLTSSNILVDSASDFVVELTSAGADQLNARGKVALGNASLVLSESGLLPTEGQQFVIVNNDEADAVTGTFAGLPEGALFSAGSCQFRVTYTGGSGNDVALIATNTSAPCRLTIRPTPTNAVVITWPKADSGWRLVFTTNLANLGTNTWTLIPPSYPTNATDCVVIETVPTGNRFYRLRKP